MNLRFLLIAVIASATLSFVEAGTIGHDKVQPFPQPEPVTESEKAAVKFKPSLIIQDGCHPYPAVNAAGETSGGLKGTGKFDGDCKGVSSGLASVWPSCLAQGSLGHHVCVVFPQGHVVRGFQQQGSPTQLG
ncbi:hypothetical protein PR002_g22239 [Phytophthora rubi]|uniref:Uncharacterized protein n=1 Tax=Phytophthora rubi TaxID=129364 RepID=A0A6A3IY92_9STRA|nr:hypothetical protein PR002_g22239 [Phytophthora rubi]